MGWVNDGNIDGYYINVKLILYMVGEDDFWWEVDFGEVKMVE